MASTFYQLSRLLGAGVGMNDALDELGSSDGPREGRSLWNHVARNGRSGRDLSDALILVLPKENKTIVALIAAGEASGRLQQACQAVSEHLQWQHDLRQRIITILVYPLFSVYLLLLVTGFLFVSVIPGIKDFLMSAGGNIDWHTRLLIDASSWISHYYPYALVMVAFVVLCVCILKHSSTQLDKTIDRCILRIPLLGRLITDLTLSRYSRCSAQLYASGVSLERSMELAEATANNQIIRQELCKLRCKLVAGSSLTESMKGVPMVPAMVSRMIYVGESSGQMADVLYTLSEQLAAASDASIKRLEQLIAPVIMIFVGIVLLWIVISVLGPVYNMAIATVMEAG